MVTVNSMEPAPDVTAQLGDVATGLSRQEHGPPLAEKTVTSSYQDAYKLEWVHFPPASPAGLQPLATVEDARDDTASS